MQGSREKFGAVEELASAQNQNPYKPRLNLSVVSCQGRGKREEGTGNREQGTGNREEGTGNREQGTGNREQGTGNREESFGRFYFSSHTFKFFGPPT